MRSDGSQGAPLGLKLGAAAGLLYLHLPLLLIFLYAFTTAGEELLVPAAGLHDTLVQCGLVRPADIWPPLWLSLK